MNVQYYMYEEALKVYRTRDYYLWKFSKMSIGLKESTR